MKARLGVHYSPPQFDFGWLIDIAGLISTLQTSHPDCLVYATLEDGMTGDKRQVLDQYDTFARVQEEMRISTKWTLCLEDTLEIEDDGVRCLTLTDSYVNGNETPEMDVIELVKNFFGLEEEPRWFLDFNDSMWCHRLFFKLPDGELIATTDFW